MHRRTLLHALAAAPCLVAASTRAAQRVPLPALGAPLPLVDVPLLDGGTFRASEAKGRVVVLYWWASWCPFCAMQSPSMQKLWDAQRSRGLAMLALSIDERIDDARRYVAQRGYTFPAAFGTPEVRRALPKPSDGLPVTCVLGRDGRVVLAEAKEMFAEDVEQIARFL